MYKRGDADEDETKSSDGETGPEVIEILSSDSVSRFGSSLGA